MARASALKALPAALDEAAAGAEVAALGEREEHPPQRIGIVVVIGEIGGERAFDGFVVPEGAIEHVRHRRPPIADQRAKLQQGREDLARIAQGAAPAAEHAEARGDRLGVAQHCLDPSASRGKARRQCRTRRRKTFREDEWRAHRAAAHLIETAGRHPLDGIEHA